MNKEKISAEKLEAVRLMFNGENDHLTPVEIRKKARLKVIASLPKPIEDIDWAALRRVVMDHVKRVIDGGDPNDPKFNHYVCEAAMSCVYGDEIFCKISQVIEK